MEEITDVIGNGFTGSIMQADSRDVKGWGGCEGRGGCSTEFVFRPLL